jgi:hypothetical protein
MALVRRRTVIVRLADQLTAGPNSGTTLIPRHYRYGKWKPLGTRHHVPSDPTLLKLEGSLRDGKHVLMNLARHAAATDLVIARLVEKWDTLSPGAQKAVTLTDLCKFTAVAPARFIVAVAQSGHETGNACVIVALIGMDIPAEVDLALCDELNRRDFDTARARSSAQVGGVCNV